MNKSYSMGKMIVRVVFIITAVLLILNFSRKLRGGADLSFSAFLNWLGNVKSFDIKLNISAWTIGGDWGIIDGLRKFLNMFGNLFGVTFYLCANLISLLIFLCKFIGFIFV